MLSREVCTYVVFVYILSYLVIRHLRNAFDITEAKQDARSFLGLEGKAEQAPSTPRVKEGRNFSEVSGSCGEQKQWSAFFASSTIFPELAVSAPNRQPRAILICCGSHVRKDQDYFFVFILLSLHSRHGSFCTLTSRSPGNIHSPVNISPPRAPPPHLGAR